MELYYTPRAEKDLVNIRESILKKIYDENLAIEVLKKIARRSVSLLCSRIWDRSFQG